jgi:phage terminase large subunit-like protein
MRMHRQTAAIENGLVLVAREAPWLGDYLHEFAVFPHGRHDDQVDATAQFLDWFKRAAREDGVYTYYRMLYEEKYRCEGAAAP